MKYYYIEKKYIIYSNINEYKINYKYILYSISLIVLINIYKYYDEIN